MNVHIRLETQLASEMRQDWNAQAARHLHRVFGMYSLSQSARWFAPKAKPDSKIFNLVVVQDVGSSIQKPFIEDVTTARGVTHATLQGDQCKPC